MLCAASFLYGQIGNEFPEMEAESLTNQMVNIPADISGKYTLIGLAYSKKSEKDLKTWFNPTYNQFIIIDRIIVHSKVQQIRLDRTYHHWIIDSKSQL